MARRSAAALEVIPNRVDGIPARLQPPDSLGDDERKVFAQIVGSVDPRHFERVDLPLLCRYCEADVLAARAAAELKASGPVIQGRVNPWLTVQEKSVRAMVALAMRLRISPQARLRPETITRRKSGAGMSADSYLAMTDDDA